MDVLALIKQIQVKYKKILSGIIACILLFNLLTINCVSIAKADNGVDENIQSNNIGHTMNGTLIGGDYTYNMDTKIADVFGEGIVEIPVDDDWTSQVKELHVHEGVAGLSYQVNSKAFAFLQRVYVPVSFTNYTSLFTSPNLEYIEVESGNTIFSSENGVLFNRNKTQLMVYPQGKKDFEYRIPEGVKAIFNPGFPGNKHIEHIFLPTSLTSIGTQAFENCSALKTVAFNEGLQSIQARAFANCTSLEAVHIPNSVKTIGNDAFSNCVTLQEIFLGSAVKTIGVDSFGGRAITVSPDNPYYETEHGVLFNKGKTVLLKYPYTLKEQTYVVPDSVSKIASCAFEWSVLSHLELPRGLIAIEAKALHRCNNLSELRIPENVQHIDDEAFAEKGCSHALRVIYGIENSYVEQFAFEHDITFIPLTQLRSSNTGVIIEETKWDVLPSEAVLQVDAFDNSSFIWRYDISLMNGAEAISLNYPVEVNIPIAENMNPYRCELFRKDANGDLLKIDTNIYSGNLVFETDRLGTFILKYFSQYKKGDVTGDQQVNQLDYEALVEVVASSTKLTPDQYVAADIDNDGVVDAFDIAELNKMIYFRTEFPVSNKGMIMPLQYPNVRVSAGWEGYPGHKGIDFVTNGPTGNTYGKEIRAVADGTVSSAEYHYSWGNNVYINHGDGIYTKYAHCSRLLVSAGQTVKQGQVIALVGNTGNVYPRPSESNPHAGAHLHFEVWVNGTRVNPAPWLPECSAQ